MDYTWQEKKDPTIIPKMEGIEIIFNLTKHDLGLFSLAGMLFYTYGQFTVEAANVCVYLATYMYSDDTPQFRDVVEYTDNALCSEIALDIIYFYDWNLPMFTFVDMLLYTFGNINGMKSQIVYAVFNRNTNHNSEMAIFYGLVMLYRRKNMIT